MRYLLGEFLVQCVAQNVLRVGLNSKKDKLSLNVYGSVYKYCFSLQYFPYTISYHLEHLILQA